MPLDLLQSGSSIVNCFYFPHHCIATSSVSAVWKIHSLRRGKMIFCDCDKMFSFKSIPLLTERGKNPCLKKKHVGRGETIFILAL